MHNLLDDNSTYEDIPIEHFDKSKKIALLLQVFTGMGMLYVDKKSRFAWFYFISFAYAFIACFNMIFWANFRIGFSFLDQFHNQTEVGALSLFIALFIAYPVALLHLNWFINKQKKNKF